MISKEQQLLRLLELGYQSAEARLAAARGVCEDINDQITAIKQRRSVQPADPADQLNHERHIGWLDRRGRELSIMAAQAAVEYEAAKDALRIQFGRKTAFSKALAARAAAADRKISH